MPETAMVTCPDCGGRKKLLGVFPVRREGTTGPPVIELDCANCDEQGQVPAERLLWQLQGEKIKAARLARNRGLREEAERLGMLPSTYCQMEHGRICPTIEPTYIE